MIYYIIHHILQNNWQATASDFYIKEHFPNHTDSATLINDIDLHLVHTNFLVDYPRLTSPNTKYVGGMHIREQDNSTLPAEIEEFVKDADHGVILFSLGYSRESDLNLM